MGVIAEGIPRGCQGLFTPVSLGYPLSVFNKNSTLTSNHIPTNTGTLHSFWWRKNHSREDCIVFGNGEDCPSTAGMRPHEISRLQHVGGSSWIRTTG